MKLLIIMLTSVNSLLPGDDTHRSDAKASLGHRVHIDHSRDTCHGIFGTAE